MEKNGHFFLDKRKSKGGRDRLAPVLPDKVGVIKAIIDKAKENGQQKLFENIPKEIDVHGLRREYAQALHNTLKDNRSLRDEYLSYYPPRQEAVKSPYYKDRQGNVFERDTVWVVSNVLGHSRIDTSIISYLQ